MLSDNSLITDDFIAKIDSLLIEELKRTRAPALSIGVIYDTQLILTRNYGAINIEENKPATSDSLYMLASITKSFTACGILKLVEQEKLSLDDKIEDFLPVKIGFDDAPIKIRHLLSHSSGIPNFSDILWFINEEDLFGLQTEIPRYPWSTWEDIFRLLKDINSFVTEKPEKRFYYNNLGYELLGKIIEEVSGTKYEDFITKEILQPLEMHNSGFYNSTLAQNEKLATPYIIKPNSKPPKLIPITYPEKRFISAAGGLFSSVNDMAKYVSMLLNNGTFNDKEIIQSENIQQMQSIQFKEQYPNLAFTSFYGKYGETGYGYGLVVHSDFFGYKLVEHSGSYEGASTWMALLPEKKLGVVFLSNHHPSPRMLAQAVLIELLGKDCYNYHPLLKLRAHHKKLTGKYETYKGIVAMQLVSRDGTLYLKPESAHREIPLMPMGNKPYNEELDYYVTTEIGGKMPVQFTIEDGNIWLHYERLKLRKTS